MSKKIIIPKDLKGKELFKFLVANKKSLIEQKKAIIKHTDDLIAPVSFISGFTKDGTTKAADSTPLSVVPGQRELGVKVIANAAWYCDLAMDVLTDKSYDRSIKERGILIPHIQDHIWKSTSHVGDVKAVYKQMMKLKDIGYKAGGEDQTTCLIFETIIKEEYDGKVYLFYKNGKINQHSIGLLYLSIGLCINDPDFLPEFELWNKYYKKVVNKDVIDEAGYFWIVPEIKVLENSCVLFACNELTGTTEMEDPENKSEESDDHPGEPIDRSENSKKMNWGTISIPKKMEPFSIS